MKKKMAKSRAHGAIGRFLVTLSPRWGSGGVVFQKSFSCTKLPASHGLTTVPPC